jgi:hypothetical protein
MILLIYYQTMCCCFYVVYSNILPFHWDITGVDCGHLLKRLQTCNEATNVNQKSSPLIVPCGTPTDISNIGDDAAAYLSATH